MKALHEKVNIVPLIAKADCLVPSEIRKLKERVSLSGSGAWPRTWAEGTGYTDPGRPSTRPRGPCQPLIPCPTADPGGD